MYCICDTRRCIFELISNTYGPTEAFVGHASRHCVPDTRYGVALISRIDKIIGLFCKRDLQKRQYSARETYDLT